MDLDQRLFAACLANDHIEVQELLAQGASASYQEAEAELKTCLHAAAENLSEEIAETLIRHGADLMAVDRVGFTPFARACITIGMSPTGSGSCGILRLLQAEGSSVLHLDVYGNTVLHVLATRGSAPGFMRVCREMASMLDQQGFDTTRIDIRVSDGPCGVVMDREELHHEELNRGWVDHKTVDHETVDDHNKMVERVVE